MFLFLVSFIPFMLLITKPLSTHLPSWVNEIRLLSFLLFKESLSHSIDWLKSYKTVSTQILVASSTIFIDKISLLNIENVKSEEKEEEEEMNLEAKMNILDLPELALDLILEKLSPNGLLNTACVCTHLREKCKGNYLWERHFSEKWGRIIGEAAKKEWKNYIDSVKDYKKSNVENPKSNWLTDLLSCAMPGSWLSAREFESRVETVKNIMQVDSIMTCYMALENGRFWFPAQVYNREQSCHKGFLLSCYDAELSYDSHTDTFHARYPPHGQRTTNVEEGVEWKRIRAPSTNTRAHQLHISDCLKELRPEDHIEIQWRRNKEFPYGWWYGAVGHLESCDRDELHCRCYDSDTIVMEFNQYTVGSRWRRTVVNRKDHREEGNESDGFYGGIRKLYSGNEIREWRKIWPSDALE